MTGNTQTHPKHSDLPASPVIEYYEALTSVRDAIKHIDPTVTDTTVATPQTQYYQLLTTIIETGPPSDGTISGFREQQRNAGISIDVYRECYGTGTAITEYQALTTTPPTDAYDIVAESRTNAIETPIHRPIPLTSDSPLPIIVTSYTELFEAIEVLSNIPTQPKPTVHRHTQPDDTPDIPTVGTSESQDSDVSVIDDSTQQNNTADRNNANNDIPVIGENQGTNAEIPVHRQDDDRNQLPIHDMYQSIFDAETVSRAYKTQTDQPTPDDLTIESHDNNTHDTREPTALETQSPTADVITRARAHELLVESVGETASFRPQQWEAINRLANYRQKLLLVQQTGWGKSTVYFITTKALREHGAGPTLIVSPLLSLMRDQMKNAQTQLGLTANTITSDNRGEWNTIYNNIRTGECDVVLVSPERLQNTEFRENVLYELNGEFGMLVIDEAHCISDWGHDFRPDYKRVSELVTELPDNTPVAATTATADNRVIDDVTQQLSGLQLIRGELVRDSLRIQAIDVGSRAKRLAWLAENLPRNDASGIIYCLTKTDVNRVSTWLSDHGCSVKPYHGDVPSSERRSREQALLNNDVDALVATNALGMGFNKPDLNYVIHFQRPPTVIRYYQEIGRAGRDIDVADAVVLSGAYDDTVAGYFINSAFPSGRDVYVTLTVIETCTDPVSIPMLFDTVSDVDSFTSDVEQCVGILEGEGMIRDTGDGYVRTNKEWSYLPKNFDRITQQRRDELRTMQEFVETDDCLALFIDERLDGEMTEPCGQCANCNSALYPEKVRDESLIVDAKSLY